MEIKQITDGLKKQNITRLILESLPEWFGIPDAREEYIAESGNKIFFCAFDNDKPLGFLYLKETGKDTVELYAMGVLKEFHRRGIGRQLFNRAKEEASKQGYSFMQVKTNKFYLSLGFQEFEVFPTLWDEWNPCQIYIMSLR